MPPTHSGDCLGLSLRAPTLAQGVLRPVTPDYAALFGAGRLNNATLLAIMNAIVSQRNGA
ncbi:hypothetical protein SAMN05428984_3631 [Sphingomonas sp. OK281]|nr:hypothetical protein SAMN05428984_3631 [Sphingomonas sp. OK281]